MTRTKVLWLLLGAGSELAAAVPVDYMQAYGECMKTAGRTNNGTVGYCSETVAEQAQVEIDRLVKEIHTSLQADMPEEAAKLMRAQQSWTKYRTSHCELAEAHVGQPMHCYCPLVLNIRRVEELRELAETRATADQNDLVISVAPSFGALTYQPPNRVSLEPAIPAP